MLISNKKKGLGGRESKEEEITIPPIHISFPKPTYVIHSKDMMDVPTRCLTAIGINILEQDDNMVKSCNEKGKDMKGEELLLQLIIHIIKETFVKTFMLKLSSGEGF